MKRLHDILYSLLPGHRLGGSIAAALVACRALSASAASDWQSDWDLPEGFSIHIDVEGFDAPTALAFVPQPGPDPKSPLYFVTELHGKLKVVTRDRSIYTFAENFFSIGLPPLPNPDGESGLAAVTLEPKHGYVFVSFAYQDTNKVLRNGMVRFQSVPGTFGLKALGTNSFNELLKPEISRVTHQAGSMVLDGDALLVSVGDGGQHLKSHDLDSTLGKILRMNFDGRPLPDNPYYEDDDPLKPRNFVWASGLRNTFGLVGVEGRLFASENGFEMDRFLELRRGENYGWDGTDWSIGLSVAAVFSPTVAPVHVAWLPATNTIFPPAYRSKFYVAFAGGKALAAGLVMFDYDFVRSRLTRSPKQFLLHLAEKRRELDPTGVAVGPDGLYVTAIYPIRHERGAKSAVLRVAYEPERKQVHHRGADEQALLIMTHKGCYSCHGQRPNDLNIAPPLDRETLVPRIIERLDSPAYRAEVRELDALNVEPYQSYRGARQAVLASRGVERARVWMKYHILEPTFDRRTSAMPSLGLTENEAQQVADYLVRRNIGDVGVTGFFKSLAQPYLFGPAKRRHLLGAFGMGFAAAIGLLLPWRALRRLAARRHAQAVRDAGEVILKPPAVGRPAQAKPTEEKKREAA
jgi:glucose/arabinose dehydrogenase